MMVMSSYSSSSGVPSGNLVTRKVDNFAGVDFSNNETNLSRSPDSLNMWKNHHNNTSEVETRPDVELNEEYDNPSVQLCTNWTATPTTSGARTKTLPY